MAKRTTRSKRSGNAGKAPGEEEIRQGVIDAAMALAAGGRWRDVSLSDIADTAELPLAAVYGVFSSKQAILAAYSREVDGKVLAGRPADLKGEPARDRLFDVIMRRLDAMASEKAALATIVQDSARDPLAAVCGACGLGRSMAAMLEAAGLASDGLRGRLRVKGLAAIYLATLRVWFRDDSEDMGKTMAKLDAALRCAERFLGRLPSSRIQAEAA